MGEWIRWLGDLNYWYTGALIAYTAEPVALWCAGDVPAELYMVSGSSPFKGIIFKTGFFSSKFSFSLSVLLLLFVNLDSLDSALGSTLAGVN